MSNIRNLILTLLVLFLLAACDVNFNPQPQPSPQPSPQSTVAPLPPLLTPPAVIATPTSAPSTFKPSALFPAGLTNEPLAVVSTSPSDKTDEAPVTKDKARIVVQFNHPVVPLVSVEAQKSLPQPLNIQPAVQGDGQWLNTSTYVFAPSQDLKVATAYTLNVKPLTDLLGQSLSGFTFSFKTTSPAILKRFPDDNTQFAATTQPISVTFNTQMDVASVQSRFKLSTPSGAGVAGKFEWHGATLLFTAEKPLDFDTPYTASLAAGAQDVNKVAATKGDVRWTFRTTKKPDVASSSPSNGEQNSRAIRQGLRINFTAPMDTKSVTVTVAPTITNQSLFFDYQNDLVARVNGNWQASTSYVVTISGESKDRYGDKIGKDVVIRFSTAPLDPFVALNVPGMMGMYDVNGAQLMYASYVNVNKIDYSLFTVGREDFLRLTGRDAFRTWENYRPPTANKLRDWSQSVQAPLNATRLISTTLTTGTPLATGVYFLEARAAGIRTPSKHLLVVTGLNLALKRTESEALVWLTDLKTGKPVANQPLTVFGPAGTPIATGKSDADGVYRATFAHLQSFEPLFVLSEVDGRLVAAVGSDWANGINPFDFSLPVQYQDQEFYANLYTDRPIYRPGQSVYFKGVLRRDSDAVYSVPSDITQVPIKVRDGEGREVFAGNLPLDRFGTFDGEVKLSDGASTGYYNISLELGSKQRPFFSNVSFIVAEYRKPEFQVEVKSDKNEYVNGDTIKLDTNTTYFFGGPVGDAKVQWRLLSDDLFFQPDNVKGYWDFTDTDLLRDRQRVGGVIREGKGTTDKSGVFHFEVPADLKEFPLGQNFTLEAEITDINNQSVASRVTVPVHKGQYYIGMKPQVYVGTVGKESAIDVLTVDAKGEPVANQTIAVSFFERKWFSVREKREDGNFYWTSKFTDTLVSKVDVLMSAQGQAVARFTPPTGGIYRIVGEGKDANGNTIRSATYQWVAGTGFVNWRQENNDRIELVSDKKQYAPGETAEILIPAPFAGAEALLTIERGTIREVKRLTLTGNSEKVQVPIRPDYAPNVFVSVMLVKGRASATEPSQFKLGYVSLDVATNEKQLSIKITSDKPQYGPGDKATYTIEATDSTGKPVEAEFSVALVDKAVQSLADEQSQSPLEAFYGRRGLAVQTATTLVRSVERLNQTVEPGSKGGGGGGEAALPPVRRNFEDTAFWNANVTTDSTGRANITVSLPDNLTTWNLTAKGVTVSTFVGEAHKDVIATKDLLVRPVTPRFFVVGDKAKIEAVVNNNSDKDLSAEVRLDAQGLTLSTSAAQTVNVKAKDKAKVSWDTVVTPADNVTVKFAVNGGPSTGSGQALNDAIEYQIPIERQASAETVATAGEVTTKIVEQIKIPANADKTAGELQIELSPSLAAASRNSLKYLESFEYDCAECTVSKFFPNVATYTTLKKLGIDRPDLRQGLEANISREVQRLYALQNTDGGWGWWRNDESRPLLTAYALLGLHQARQAGFTINQDVMNRAEQFLVKYLEKPVDVNASYAHNERAFVIFTLTEMGRNYTSRAVNLYDQRANLGNYGKALLLMAMQKLKMAQEKTLLAELTSAAIQSASGAHWEEAKQDYFTLNTNTRSTALAVMALSRGSRGEVTSPLLASAVRWLMVARASTGSAQAGHWPTTQETAWSVLALTEYMQATGELTGNYTYQVLVNGKLLSGDVKVDQSNIDQPKVVSVPIKDLVQDAANELLISRGAGDGKLYYSANLKYYLPAENIPALNKGILIGRQYYAVDQATLKPTDTTIASAKVGDYVLVKLVIVAPSDLHYLAVEDPLPAGFEAVDNTLKTASVAAQSGGLKEQQPQQPSGDDRWFKPYWSYWAHSEVRDDRVAVFATYLGKGTYEYTYMLRASVAGEFRTLPARAWQMYFPDVMGRSAGTVFQVVQ